MARNLKLKVHAVIDKPGVSVHGCALQCLCDKTGQVFQLSPELWLQEVPMDGPGLGNFVQ